MKVTTAFRVVMQLSALSLIISGCGGSDNPAAVETTAVSGSVFAAPVSGASVVVKNAQGAAVAGPVMAAADGTFTVNVPTTALSTDLRIESTGGTYSDEATGMTVTAGTLAAYVTAGSLTAGSAVHIDPASTIVHSLVTQGSRTPGEAGALFNAAFGFTPDCSVAPRNTPSSAETTTAQRVAGLRAGAFSQLTRDLGLAPDAQCDLLAAIGRDLADGTLDGRNASAPVSIGTGTAVPEDIQNRFERSLVSFQTNTTCNQTGLASNEIGMLPFSKVALTDTYRVEYVPGMMPAVQGRTVFTLKVNRRSDGAPAPGLALSLKPLMYMATRNHRTPVDAIVDNGDGTYTCAVYYLMSSMMNGTSMGFWELKVLIGGETGEAATFYPSVGMAMGSNTVRATLKGVGDLISTGTGTATEKRGYYLFNDGLTGTSGNYAFKLFVAVKESMMSFPAIAVGAVLHDQLGAAWTVNTMTVEASTDGTTWAPATNNAGGHWTASGLPLVSGTTGTVYVRTTVNGEVKTLDGLASTPTGTNGFATFTLTPGM